MTMSKLTRNLIFGVALAAMNLAATTAIAQAHTSDDPASTRHRALGQLEFLTGDDTAAAQDQPGIADDTRRPPTEAPVDESWSHPGNVRARPAQPSGQPGWVALGLGVLAAALALPAVLAATIVKQTRGRVRVRQTA
jgi:hypothetical protein